jgi:hypothetical protein
MPRPGEVAIALSLAIAALAAGYALYSAVGSADAPRAASSRSTAQPELSSIRSVQVDEPLRVANPFDASEIFEFPAGTSEADAHKAIAGFLLERATRRGVTGSHRNTSSKG